MSAPKIEVYSRTVRAVVSLNLGADDWQLYDEPGRDEAATELNRSIEGLLAEGAAPESAAFWAVLNRPHLVKLGAADSEGYAVLHSILRAAGVVAD
jgi:hypothetical protein